MKRVPEAQAIYLLQQIVDMDRKDSDALPGSVVKLVKKALVILKKRRK